MLAFILCANIAPDKWFILTATSSTTCPSPWLSPLYITDCEYKANDGRTYTPSQDPPPLSHAVGSALALRYAVHDSLVMADFFGLFLLKIANLFSAELDLGRITVQVELLSDIAAERYTLALLTILANVRRKLGLAPNRMSLGAGPFLDPSIVLQPAFTVESSAHGRTIAGRSSPSIMLWLQEQNLRLPVNGSDGIFFADCEYGWMDGRIMS